MLRVARRRPLGRAEPGTNRTMIHQLYTAYDSPFTLAGLLPRRLTPLPPGGVVVGAVHGRWGRIERGSAPLFYFSAGHRS